MSFRPLRSPLFNHVLANPALPTVYTNAASSIATTTADGNGEVANDGNSAITQRGFCWSTSVNPTTADSTVTSAGTLGVYSATMTGLSSSTTYHYRAYAINAVGTAYGADVTFNTTSSTATYGTRMAMIGVGM